MTSPPFSRLCLPSWNQRALTCSRPSALCYRRGHIPEASAEAHGDLPQERDCLDSASQTSRLTHYLVIKLPPVSPLLHHALLCDRDSSSWAPEPEPFLDSVKQVKSLTLRPLGE